MSEEIEEVQEEANEIEDGWGEKIWRLASELRQVRAAIPLALRSVCTYADTAHPSANADMYALLLLPGVASAAAADGGDAEAGCTTTGS